MKTFIILVLCSVVLAERQISVKNQDEATELMDNVLKFMKGNPKFDSAPLKDIEFKFSRQFVVASFNGVISLTNGRISGIGTNPHRHGKSTISQRGEETIIRVSTHLMNMDVEYNKVKLQQLAGGILPPEDVQRLSGQIKDMSAIMTFKIDEKGELCFEDLDVKKTKEVGFKFHGSSNQLINTLLNNIIEQTKKAAFNAIATIMKEVVKEYQKQL